MKVPSDSINDDVSLGCYGDTVKVATAKFFREKIEYRFKISTCLSSPCALKAWFRKGYNRSCLSIRYYQQSDV